MSLRNGGIQMNSDSDPVRVPNVPSESPEPVLADSRTQSSRTGKALNILIPLLTAAVGVGATWVKTTDDHRASLIQQRKDLEDARAKAAEAESKTKEGAKKAENMLNAVLVSKDDMQVYQELAKHASDTEREQKEVKQESLHADGSLTIEHFFSDGCVQVIRKTLGKKPDTKWLFGPNVVFNQDEAPRPRLDGEPKVEKGSVPKPGLESGPAHMVDVRQTVEERLGKPENNAKLLRSFYQGRCIDPHPGAFSYSNESNGCIHFQYFNPCNGSWDVWPNGAPKVTWLRCVH
jgi:hypothetical protein